MKILISLLSWNYTKQAITLANSLAENEVFDIYILENGVHPIKSNAENLFIHENVKYNKTKENKGYADGHQQNFSIVNYKEYDGVLILNPDIKTNANFLDELVKVIRKTKNKSIIGGPIYQLVDNNLEKEYFGYPITEEEEKQFQKATYVNNEVLLPLNLTINHLKDIHGCMFYIPTNVILQYGWMDSNYFLYGEENDYFFRLNKQVDILVSATLPILHENSGSFKLFSTSLENIKDYYTSRNKLYNLKKHYGFLRALKAINYKFILKFFTARYILRITKFKNDSKEYYAFLGVKHFLLNKMGKQINPNDYVK